MDLSEDARVVETLSESNEVQASDGAAGMDASAEGENPQGESPVTYELVIEDRPVYDDSVDGSVVNDARVRGWLSSFYSACTGVDPGLIEGVDVDALNKSTHDLGWLTGGLFGAAIGWLVGRIYGDITGGRAVKKNVDALRSGALASYIGG